jgi:SRSO17 transposase
MASRALSREEVIPEPYYYETFSMNVLEIEDLTSETPVALTRTPRDLADLADELRAYHARFAPLFRRREQEKWAEVYLRGLLLTDVPRKNVEAMVLRLQGAGPAASRTVRAVQQFISEGAWSDAALLNVHQELVEVTLGEDDGVFTIAGCDIPKQGDYSVGVAEQWCTATGRWVNCQAGVYLGYASRRGYTLLDRRLYLPHPWTEKRRLRDRCAIPKSVCYQTKVQLAAEMVEQAQRQWRARMRWLVCGEGFGQDDTFLDQVAATGLWYLAEVPGSLRDSCIKLLAQDPDHDWRRYRILDGSNESLVADFAAIRARQGTARPVVWVLFQRPVGKPDAIAEVKFYWSSAPEETPLKELVRVCGMHWTIKSCFEEAKSMVGLDQYELRSWPGWHHHMTLVILAHHFLVWMQAKT